MMMAMSDIDPESKPSRMLSPSTVAERLSVSEGSVRRAIRTGELRAARLGTRWLIPESEIDRLIASAS